MKQNRWSSWPSCSTGDFFTNFHLQKPKKTQTALINVPTQIEMVCYLLHVLLCLFLQWCAICVKQHTSCVIVTHTHFFIDFNTHGCHGDINGTRQTSSSEYCTSKAQSSAWKVVTVRCFTANIISLFFSTIVSTITA